MTMMPILRALVAFSCIVVTGCAANRGAHKEVAIEAGASAHPCQPQDLSSFIGQKATAETAARMLAVSGARVLRWVPPRTAVTMDFREDRLTVSYNDDMIIHSVSCG